ncbi:MULTISPECIES: rhodanese-like domain-containing protein [Thermaceae]|uniref:Sulfurtransferase n=4 Tax=Meiothermus TaxID=65551 RepID=A0A511R6B4_9DEIN|nr:MULTISPECIES: rhodanese-like domain-containing protein [Thermaceae]AWR87955.1 rhodanese-like protein [Meiothermus taiwanensis WR-220]RIH80462.1 putative adenylyltransferase/sulfurtransferase MoeZ [Meiothermus hypogaeus]GEM84787.1 sulfurtransferase [Meiothermus hypogaeus NBRC 106114]GIW29738.1 MAG: sulfurtransferase [Meiothermus sp.]
MGRLRPFLACRVQGFSPCRVTPWLLAVLAVLMLFNGCAPKPGYKDVSVQELRAASEPGRVVLDVREPYEYAEGHVPGSTLLPLGQVAARAGQLPKDAPVYVICRSGNRSVQASRTLAELGFKDVRNVQGGILAWQSAGYPLER